MKIELEPQDIQAIAEKVVEMLKSYLSVASEERGGPGSVWSEYGHTFRHRLCTPLLDREVQRSIASVVQ